MNYVPLGSTGLMVSPVCFGTMSFGGNADQKMSAALYKQCRDYGINFYDCADMYQAGLAEEILGKLIAHERDKVIITSKAYFPTDEDINARGATRRHLRLALEASLKRLKTDYIDLYFIHRFDDATPLEETLRGLEDAVRHGKVLHLGASNFAAWQVAKALGISSKFGWKGFDCIQPMYNLVKRQAETELLPMAASEGLAVIPYSPLGGGLLTGKYGKNKRPESGRLVENEVYQQRYGAGEVYEVADALVRLAADMGVSPATLAVSWVAAHPAVTAPIIGARNLNQLQPSLDAINFEMTAELRAKISSLSRAPALATDRSEEGSGKSYLVR